jgi:hypothetical protein
MIVVIANQQRISSPRGKYITYGMLLKNASSADEAVNLNPF